MRATGCSLCFGTARDAEAARCDGACDGAVLEMKRCVGARGFDSRGCPSRGRCLPRGDGVGNDREILAGFGALCGAHAGLQRRRARTSQQVACFALLLQLKKLPRAIPVLLSPAYQALRCSESTRAHRCRASILGVANALTDTEAHPHQSNCRYRGRRDRINGERPRPSTCS